MAAEITIKLYGSLSRAFPHLQDGETAPRSGGAQPLKLFLADLGIDVQDVQLVMRNHRAVGFDTSVRPGDRLALFPREYPFFVDWQAFRQAHLRPPENRPHGDRPPEMESTGVQSR